MTSTSIDIAALVWNNQTHLWTFVHTLVRSAEQCRARLNLVFLQNGPEGIVDKVDQIAVARLIEEAGGDCRWILSARNLGYAGGMNEVVRFLTARTDSQLALFVNLDVAFDRGFLPAISSALKSSLYDFHCSAGFAVGDEQSGSIIGRRSWDNRLHRAKLSRLEGRKLDGCTGACIPVFWAAISRRIGECGFLFDPRFFAYGEDQELMWWLCRQELQFVPLPHAKVMHVGSASTNGKTSFRHKPRWLQRLALRNYIATNVRHSRSFRERGMLLAGIVRFSGLTIAAGESVFDLGRTIRAGFRLGRAPMESTADYSHAEVIVE